MPIVVLGASGFVGSRIFFDLKDQYELIGTRFSSSIGSTILRQLDVTNKEKLQDFLQEIQPEVIIHAANNPS